MCVYGWGGTCTHGGDLIDHPSRDGTPPSVHLSPARSRAPANALVVRLVAVRHRVDRRAQEPDAHQGQPGQEAVHAREPHVVPALRQGPAPGKGAGGGRVRQFVLLLVFFLLLLLPPAARAPAAAAAAGGAAVVVVGRPRGGLAGLGGKEERACQLVRLGR